MNVILTLDIIVTKQGSNNIVDVFQENGPSILSRQMVKIVQYLGSVIIFHEDAMSVVDEFRDRRPRRFAV